MQRLRSAGLVVLVMASASAAGAEEPRLLAGPGVSLVTPLAAPRFSGVMVQAHGGFHGFIDEVPYFGVGTALGVAAFLHDLCGGFPDCSARQLLVRWDVAAMYALPVEGLGAFAEISLNVGSVATRIAGVRQSAVVGRLRVGVGATYDVPVGTESLQTFLIFTGFAHPQVLLGLRLLWDVQGRGAAPAEVDPFGD